MKNSALKRFLGNKNTVTIIGTILIVLVLYVGYQARISSAIRPVRVPVARETIQPRTRITSDMVMEISVPSDLLQGRAGQDIITNREEIIDRFSNVNALIPQYSLFFRDAVLDRRELPDLATLELQPGEVLFNLPVSMETTFGNSLFPGNFIDIYFKSLNDDRRVQYGRLIANVRIIAVKDSEGRNVFDNTEERRRPAMLIFAVPSNMNILLRQAMYLREFNAELIPVPLEENTNENVRPTIASNFLASFIRSKTVNVPTQEIMNVAPEIPETNDGEDD